MARNIAILVVLANIPSIVQAAGELVKTPVGVMVLIAYVSAMAVLALSQPEYVYISQERVFFGFAAVERALSIIHI